MKPPFCTLTCPKKWHNINIVVLIWIDCFSVWIRCIIYEASIQAWLFLCFKTNRLHGDDLVHLYPYNAYSPHWLRLMYVLRQRFCCCWIIVYCCSHGRDLCLVMVLLCILCGLSSFPIILMERKCWMFYLNCLLDVLWLLEFFGSSCSMHVLLIFHDHTHLYFLVRS